MELDGLEQFLNGLRRAGLVLSTILDGEVDSREQENSLLVASSKGGLVSDEV
jgi:hypothetical protein